VTPEINVALFDVFRLIVPELVLGVAACVLFLGATFRADRHLWALISLLALLGAGVALWYSPRDPLTEGEIYAGPIVLDRMALLIKAIALAGGFILVLFSWDEVPDRQAAEYYACLILIVAGLCLTGASNELITLFLALELISIPTYVLLYMPRFDNAAQEAAVKYFLLSVFSSGLLLFGFSYLYGLVGTTNLPALVETMTTVGPDRVPGIAQVALVMVVAGLGFKITAVPFHFYAPDVYQGTPTVAAAMLAFVPKVAGFAALLRVLGFVYAGQVGSGLALGLQVSMLFYILAVVTMSLGNLLALLQDNIKRLLAYSSVAHAGYMLIGLATAPDLYTMRGTAKIQGGELTGGVDAILFYLVAYGAMTVGAFAVLAYLSTPQRPVETVDDLAGLSGSHPATAFLMMVFLFSLIGMPLTAGFAGKMMLFWGALAVNPPEHPWLFPILAVVGALNAAVGGWYYLRIIAVMYLRPSVKPLERARSVPELAAICLCAALTLAFGIFPGTLARYTRGAAASQQRQDRSLTHVGEKPGAPSPLLQSSR
jgi:NADH-quinone oxidoreductase subunit N